MEAKVTYIDGLQFVGEASSGHAIVVDGETAVGGKNSGLRPSELLLIGLGGCTGMDVISILKKKQQNVTGFELNVTGDKAQSHPQKITNMNVEYVIKGKNIDEAAVKRSIELSTTKFCAVKATLQDSVEITTSYKIVDE